MRRLPWERPYYWLNAAGEAERCHDALTWATWFETADRQIAQTVIDEDTVVSTVFLGMDHNWAGGPPVLWETLVFGGALDGTMDRYQSREEAEAGHREMVARALVAGDYPSP